MKSLALTALMLLAGLLAVAGPVCPLLAQEAAPQKQDADKQEAAPAEPEKKDGEKSDEEKKAEISKKKRAERKAKAEAEEAEAAKKEAEKTEPAKVEPAKTEPAKSDPPKTEAPKPEPAKTEAPKPEPAKPEAPKTEPAKTDAPPPEPTKVEPPAPPPLRKDKDVEALLKNLKFTRRPEEAFRAASAAVDQDLPEPDRLLRWVQAGRWEEVGEFLKLYEPEAGRRIHLRIGGDLTSYGTPRPVVLPAEVIRFADASPVELDDRQAAQTGRMLFYAMIGSESSTELMNILQKGTTRLGGADPARRRITAKLLASAEFWNEAKAFGLPDSEIKAGVVLEQQPVAPKVERTWEQLVVLVRDPATEPAVRTEAFDGLYEALLSATPSVLQERLTQLLGDAKQMEFNKAILGLVGEKTAAGLNQVDFRVRALNLELQRTAVETLAKNVKLDEPPVQTIVNLYAHNWETEALNTLKMFPSWQKSTTREKYPHVSLEEMIRTVPFGAWMKAISPQLSPMVKNTAVRLVLYSEDIDRAVDFIRELKDQDPQGAAKLANSYLGVWAHNHDPNLSADVLKQLKVDNQAIVLTRSEQEASLKSLGKLLSTLDPTTRGLLDEAQVITAFDVCHSKAEVYTASNMEAVFGKLDTMPPTLILTLVERMRLKLASQWRDLSVQRDAATRRTAADVFDLVNEGYAEASNVTGQWLTAHPDDWRMSCAAGSTMADWSEFSYFQAVIADNNQERFAKYLERSNLALERFRNGAKGYAAAVPQLKRKQFDLLPYRAWFYSLLGITHDGGVNLRKGVTREGLDEVRKAMTALPGGAADVHLQMFSTMVADNVAENRIAPEMKYRYLSSAVQITGRNETVYPAEEKIQYYDSLLKEIRLQTVLDGSDRINAKGQFGVFVSLVHTADLARESGGFSKYLMNEVAKTVSGKAVVEKPLYRDRFEEALRVALGDFFTIRSIVFADPAGGSRPLVAKAKKDGDVPPAEPNQAWQETPLAYLFLEVKDATVDRVPALEIELDFYDREGKVVIPVPSNPVQIEITDDAPVARPVSHVAITQIVDSRELKGGLLKIDVMATAHGLVPDLKELLKLDGYSPKVLEVNDSEALHVTKLQNDATGVYPTSERTWTVQLDPTPLVRGASQQITFEFPQPVKPETEVIYRTYQDMDPVDAAAQITLIEGKAVDAVARPNYWIWGGALLFFVAAVAGLIYISGSPAPEAAERPAFVLPREVNPFSIVALLHHIQSNPSVKLTDDQLQTLRKDIHSVERGAFTRDTESLSKQDLETLARRWISTVAPAAS